MKKVKQIVKQNANHINQNSRITSCLASKSGTPGATRTPDTRFRKACRDFTTSASYFVPESAALPAQILSGYGVNILTNCKGNSKQKPDKNQQGISDCAGF